LNNKRNKCLLKNNSRQDNVWSRNNSSYKNNFNKKEKFKYLMKNNEKRRNSDMKEYKNNINKILKNK
jgi:hypothetical protein